MSDYREAIRVELTKLDAAALADDYLLCRDQFALLARDNADEWLPVYYTAYCDIQMAYMHHPDAPALLEDARSILEKLDTLFTADRSEVHTLWGYYYTALIALDKAAVPKYAMQAIDRYEKASALNPNNPRPVCLLAFFKQYMPPSMRSDREIAEGKAAAEALFKNETPSLDKPYWGVEYLQWIHIH
jgi:hypothetical protein